MYVNTCLVLVASFELRMVPKPVFCSQKIVLKYSTTIPMHSSTKCNFPDRRTMGIWSGHLEWATPHPSHLKKFLFRLQKSFPHRFARIPYCKCDNNNHLLVSHLILCTSHIYLLVMSLITVK